MVVLYAHGIEQNVTYVAPVAAEAKVQEEKKPLSGRVYIDKLINDAAEQYQVSPEIMHAVIECESNYVVDVQSKHRYTFTDARRGIYLGEREQSFGLGQIHLPDHPTVSYTEAIDPVFAVDFLAKALANGKGSWWTCFRNLGA